MSDRNNIVALREKYYIRAICLGCMKEHTDFSFTVCPDCGGPVPLVWKDKTDPMAIRRVDELVEKIRNDPEFRALEIKRLAG